MVTCKISKLYLNSNGCLALVVTDDIAGEVGDNDDDGDTDDGDAVANEGSL